MKHAHRPSGQAADASAIRPGKNANTYLDDPDPQVSPSFSADASDPPDADPHPTAMLAYVDDDSDVDHAKANGHAPGHAPVHAAHPAHAAHAAPAHGDHATHPPDDAAKLLATVQAGISHVTAVVGEEMAKEQQRRALQEQKDKVSSSINDTKAVAIGFELAMYSRSMDDATSRAFIQRLDSLDDPDLRHKVMAQFEAQTGKKLDAFIKGCNSWNNNGDNRDKAAALQLISPERDQADAAVANMKPEERAAAQQKALADADAFLLATAGRDHSDANSQKVFRLLEKKSPAEIEMLRAAIRTQSKGEFNLYERIDYGMHKGDEDEAVAMMSGDHLTNATMALGNETDPKRFAEVIGNLSDAERARAKTEPYRTMMLGQLKNASDRAVAAAALDGNQDLALGEQLGNMMKPKDEGMSKEGYVYDEVGRDNFDRRNAKKVLAEFESMSGEQAKAAVDAWDKAHPDRPMMKMLDARWGNDEDKTEYLRLKAMMEGDKGKDRSLRLEESIREGDQDEREAALRHEKTDEAALNSKDDKVRKHALEVKAENDSFERNNVEADHEKRVVSNMLTGRHDDTTGHSTKEQLTDYFATQKAKDVKSSYEESVLRANGQDSAADAKHAADRKKHEKSVDDLDIAAMELLDDGKLSPETEFHRGKGAKEKAAALENVTSNKELEAAQKAYKDKYGEDMLPDPKKDRADMNANELMIDNVRRYGARAERPAQVEAMLEIQQYEKQKSSSLEYDEEGRGTQEYQRILMERQREMLKDPKFAVHAPKFVSEVNGQKLPFPQLVEDPNEPTFEDSQAAIDKLQADAGGDIHKVDDGLKEGVKKSEFNAVDKQLVAANAAQEEAKKRLAERFVKIFSTIAKIAAVLTANPWLIALIDIGEGLIEMGIKHEVMGEAYDPGEDLKMLAITGAADIALLGFSKLGELKGAARMAESEALGVTEKAAMEVGEATTAEAKSEAVREGVHAAAGESKALQGALEEAGSVEKAGSEVASEAGHQVEQKVADVAEGKALNEGEGAAAKAAESEAAGDVAKGASAVEDAEKAAEKIRANYGMAGGAAKMVVQTVGGGIAQGKSPTDILKGLVTGSLGLVLPGKLADKVKAAIGNPTLAAKILGEISGFGTEVLTNTTINVAGGAEGGDALFDSALGAGGARAQHAFGHHGAGPAAQEEHAPAAEEHAQAPAEHAQAPVAEEPSPVMGGREPMEMGGENVSLQRGESDHRVAANTQEVAQRSNEKLARMDEASRAEHAELFAKAENRGQQVLLERAVAAGRKKQELDVLMAHMSGKSEAEVMREYSGAALVQFYQQSCVPASYQIALAERDPLWALHFKSNPEDVMNAQRNALIIGDAHQTQRDLASAPENLKQHVEDPAMRQVLEDQTRYAEEGKNERGMDPAEMKGTQLHSQLEDATGSKYEVLTEEQFQQGRADGTFELGAIPHDRIGRALDAQKPVLIGAGNHERVIIGREVRPDKKVFYIVTDPHDGTTTKVPQENLLGEGLGSITLPSEGGEAEMPAPHEEPAGQSEELSMGGKRSEEEETDPGGRGKYKLEEPLRENLGSKKLEKLDELQGNIPESPGKLRELVKLRKEAAGGKLPPVPGTPEHMLARWNSYEGEWDFDRWAAGHPSRMENSVQGLQVEKEYRTALKKADIQSDSGFETWGKNDEKNRQIDIQIQGGAHKDGEVTGDHMIQIKSGDESLTTNPRESGGSSRGSSSLSNKDALALDHQLIEQGNRVTWVFEKHASGPLVKEALKQGVEVIMHVDSPNDTRALLEAAGMTKEQIDAALEAGTLVFVRGGREALKRRVVEMASEGQ